MAATKEMVLYCFATLHSHLHDTEEPEPAFDVTQKFPFFVTWEKGSDECAAVELRGCIGTLSPTRLADLGDYCLSSATRDSRFDPITIAELADLHCSVSLLVNYEDVEHYADWQVGVHGIVIKFQGYSATYLPEVASNQGWSQKQTIESLIRKAGYRKKVTPQLLEELHVTRYQSSKMTLTYAQFVQAQA